jgi:hypothetical protein
MAVFVAETGAASRETVSTSRKNTTRRAGVDFRAVFAAPRPDTPSAHVSRRAPDSTASTIRADVDESDMNGSLPGTLRLVTSRAASRIRGSIRGAIRRPRLRGRGLPARALVAARFVGLPV